jgi:hypothetical protein
MGDSVAGRLDALESAFVILADLLAERGAVDADALRRLLGRRARTFRTDHGAAADPLGTAHTLEMLAGAIGGSTDWLRREHD